MLRCVRIVAFVLTLVLATAASSFCQKPSLDQTIASLLTQHHVPSVSIAEIEGGRIVLLKAYGMQSADAVATTSTLYNVASMTKPVSAETALRLISRDVFSLDEPMYATWLDPDIASDPRSKLLTTRICLSHLTGFASNWRSDTGNTLQFKAVPGTTYLYSGEGYEYVSHFVQKKTGENLAENARKLVFDPIGMKDTSYQREPWFEGRIAIPADAQGEWLKPRFAPEPVASDLLYTTPSDYARFMLSVMRNEGLRSAIAAERSRVQFSLRPVICPKVGTGSCPEEVGPGLGWQVVKISGKRYLTHTGHDPGLYTFGYLSADSKSGIVIFTNGERGSQLVIPILQSIGRDQEFVEFLSSMIH